MAPASAFKSSFTAQEPNAGQAGAEPWLRLALAMLVPVLLLLAGISLTQ